MARIGLPHWLRGDRKYRRAVPEEQRKRPRGRFYRPQLEQLEDRLAPGSLLVNVLGVLGGEAAGEVLLAPDAALDLAAVTRPAARPLPSDEIKPLEISYPPVREAGEGGGGGHQQPLSARSDEQPAPTTSTQVALESGQTALDSDLFVALAGVFGSSAKEGGGGGGGLDSAAGLGGAVAGGDSGTAGGGAAPSGGSAAGGFGGTAGGYGDGSAGGASMPPSGGFVPPVHGGGTGPVQSSLSSGPQLPPGVGQVSQPAGGTGHAPVATTSSGGTAHPPVPAGPPQPIVTPPAAPVVTFTPPVLESVAHYGLVGHGYLFIQGSVGNTAPLGTKVQLDFYAAGVRSQGSGVRGQGSGVGGAGWEVDTGSARLIGSKTVTQTKAGSIDFTVNLETEVPPGTMIAAAVHGRDAGPNWSQGVELFDGQHGAALPGQALRESATVPAGIHGENVTLASPGHSLENIQVIHPPGLDKQLPLGLIGFTVTNVPVGGTAVVIMTLPADVHMQTYYMMDPVTGKVSAFPFDGQTGAEMHGQVVTLHLKDGGRGDGKGAADGVILDPGGPGTQLSPNLDVCPAATTGEFVTLDSPAYPLTSVQSYDPPVTGVDLPLGLFGFTVTGLPIGGEADVQMTLPSDVIPSGYIKQDPVTGVLTQFACCSDPNATFDGQTITLHLVDGGAGDADGNADGVIVDPGGPSAGTITIPCGSGLTGWTVFQTGGSGSGVGTVTYNSGTSSFVINEGNSFDTGLSHSFTIPTTPNILTFNYSGPTFDPSNTSKIEDAFEAAFVDSTGKSLVPTIAPGRNAFFNVTNGQYPLLAPGVTLQNGQVDLDISKLFANTTGTLIFRMVNNDGATASTVSISCVPAPAVTVALANDTAPTGPGTDPYRHDLLTTNPTVTGTATDAAGITKLQASVDGGAYTDITSTLNLNQYTWNPGTLAYGSHTITILATDSAQQQMSASITFTVDTPPVANAGGNQTVNEGNVATFDGSLSTSTSGIYSHLWTFPDGSTSSGAYGQFRFVQAGTYAVTLAITDIAGAVSTNTATMTIVNLPPVVTGIGDQIINEGGTASFQTTFTDAGVLDTHTASINWGDGSTTAGTVVEASGAGTASGSHVYLEEGVFPATVTVTDNGGASGTATFDVTVNDQPPTLTISGSSSVNEGTSYVLTLGATPGPDPVTGWTINWGDGNTSTAAAGATSASHVYADGLKQYLITATGTTDDTTLNANTLLVTVNNIAPAVSISGPASTNEGSTYTLTLSGTPDSVDSDAITGWSINWGDGGTTVLSNNPTSATHIYQDGPNNYTISANASDVDGSYSSNTVLVTVNDVAPTVTAKNISGQTGQTLTFTGNFSDPGILDTQHTATINWGDGSANTTGTLTPSTGISGMVSGTHSYSTAGTYTITLTINPVSPDTISGQATATATITALALNPTISGNSSVNEGASYTLNLSFSGSPAPTSWTIYWGDGSSNTYSGNPSSETHTYADGPNQYSISATATNSNGTYASNILAVTVNAINPTVSVSGASSVNEAATYTLNLSATTDSADHDTITGWNVVWGDGMTQNVSGNPSSVTHVYTDGPFTYTNGLYAYAIDENGSYLSNKLTLTVNDLAPTVNTASNLTGTEGQALSFLGTYSDPGVLDTHSATINWGDNSSSTGTVTEANGSGAVTGTHTYAETGSYTITLTVNDKDTGDTFSASKTAAATITNVNPTVTPAANQTAVLNQPISNLQVATFSDPGFTSSTAGTTETYTASINWGDNTSSSGTVATTAGSPGVPTTGTVTGNHTYTAAGNYTVTVTVTDDDNLSGQATFIVHVQSSGATKFFVVDQPAHHVFTYDQWGNLSGGWDTSTNNQRGWGIVSNAAMNTLWIVDANRNVQVYVYKPDGTELGRWIADNVANAQDIATDGSNIWLLDNAANRVRFYAGGAGWTNGHHAPTSSFALNSSDQYPTGMVTDGSTIWVTDTHGSSNNVFVYDTSGNNLGSWALDPADGDPQGITLNPNYQRGSATDLWVVDKSAAKVFRYAGGSAWRSGNQTAASSFALASGDQHPYGITDPTITVQTPPSGASYPQGSPYLVSGTATPSPTYKLEGVTVNGTAATIDAGGNFFQQLTATPGNTTLSLVATDSGGSANASVSVTGTAPVKATPTNPTAIDFSMLSDVTGSFSVSYGHTSFNNGTNILYAEYTATNNGTYWVRPPLVVEVKNISDPSVRVAQNTGLMADGTPFYDLSSLVTTTAASGAVAIGPGQSTQTTTLAFSDPNGTPFTYTLVFLARLDRPPRFTSVPVVTVMAGQTYNYTTTAVDPENDYLIFSKVSGPPNLVYTDTHAGTLTWVTATTDAGTYPIRLRVNDNNGGTADQTFVLSVVPSGVNYPPYFTSTPIVDAAVGTLYSYQATDADLDNDAQTFNLVSGPAGMTMPSPGLVQWTPTLAQLGTQNVTLKVTDAAGAYAQQAYSILVQLPPGNLIPYFTSTPVTTVAAGSFYVYPSRAIDADSDPVTYTLTQAPGSMVIDPITGQVTWQTFTAMPTGGYPVTIQASDGKPGGTATQSFTVTVTSSSTALGAIFGTKYNDLDGNGLRESTASTSSGLGPIALQQAATSIVPFAIDYHQPTNSMLVEATINNNTGIYRIQPDGTSLLYASLPGVVVVDGSSLTTVRSNNTAGFTPGDIFVANNVRSGGGTTWSGQIIKITNGGATVTNPWVTLATSVGIAALYLDQTGQFGNQLLAVLADGEFYQINSSGTATKLVTIPNVSLGLGGETEILTVPNNNSLYGPMLSGQAVVINDFQSSVTVSPSGAIGYPHGPPAKPPGKGGFFGQGQQYSGTGLDNAEGEAIVTPATNFFAIADTQSLIATAAGSQFTAINGQIIVTHEHGGTSGQDWFDRVWFDGTYLQTQQLQFTAGSTVNLPWYQDAFVPIGLGPVAAPPLEPGIPNWTIQLINPNNGQVLQSTTTDANGRYAFVNLAAASYTVAEVQQPGWTQRGPTPVPPGTYSVTLAAGQLVYSQDFGNQWTGGPLTTTPPTGTVDQPAVFGTTPPNPGTATVGQTFVYNATATDPESDYPLVFDLPVHPAGMAVDPQLGVLFWQPTASQAGLSAPVLLRVTDTKGSVALQSFTVNVVAANNPPVITSTPPTSATSGQPYQYAVQAQDPDQGETLTYSLVSPPSGMTINASTGVLSWPSPVVQPPNHYTTYTITVQVADNGQPVLTNSQTYTLTVALAGTNGVPTITSNPRTAIEVGQQYVYVVQAGDSDGDPLTYSLPTKPTGMGFASGYANVITWTPAANQLGANSVTVQVSDGRSGGTVTQSFTINVQDTLTNQPPTITSVPPLTAVVGQLYSYYAVATSPSNDPLVWKLLSGPSGMSLNPNLGTLAWTPTGGQEPSQSVTLQVLDPYGGTATQTWTIQVTGVNQPPVISSTPVTQAQVSKLYSYAVVASDPDGDALTYSASGPRGLAISSSGVVTYTPGATGSYAITITASDSSGNSAVQNYTLTVSSSVNQAPVITSTAVTTAVAGNPYSYPVAASDPDGETVSYAVTSNPAASGLGFTGNVLGWSSPVAGTYQITITVSDSATPAATAKQYYTLSVTNDPGPTISNWSPPTTILAGQTYRYDVQASDADGDALTYALNGAPSGLTINSSTGSINWPAAVQGTYNGISVTVTDPYGKSYTSPSFNLTVSADTTPPTVQLQMSPNPIVSGNQETILVQAMDDVSVASMSLTVGGANVPLDAHGQAVVTMTTTGSISVSASATDPAGNTGTATGTITVNAAASNPPTVQITAPVPASGAATAVVTAPVSVTGTAAPYSGATFNSWTVSIISFDGTVNQVIASGTTPITNGTICTFDPTMLANGDYTLQLTATDTLNSVVSSATTSEIVSVEAHLKLGRETLSVTDLTIPVAGIPITITRTYDSLNAGKNMDFGYGWQLSYGDAQLKVDLQPGYGQQWGDYPAFTNGTHVYVTLPGGDREGFTFQPVEVNTFFQLWAPVFVPDPGVIDQLTVPYQELTQDQNQYFTMQAWGLESYNPADPVYGDQYTVTKLDGTGYQIAADTGKLTGMTARNGNTLTFSPTAITSNTGRTVVVNRNPAAEITSITDPRGNSVTYGYDVNGNLGSVTDRANDPATAYKYDTTHAHYLTAVVDPLGVQQLLMQYDSNGRLTSTTDAKQNVIGFGFNTTALTETVSDPQTPSTTVTFNQRGDQTQLVDPTGAQWSATYGNTLPGQVDLPDSATQIRRNPDGSTTRFTTHLAYDANGNLTSLTDPTGAVTRITYGQFGAVLTRSDALGNTTALTYDTQGNLLTSTSPQGVFSSYGYNGQNNLTSVMFGGMTSLFSYNSSGYISASTTSNGITTSFFQDANGNAAGTSTNWVNPQNSSDIRPLTTSALFDANDRLTSTTDQYGNPSQVQYDAKGRVTKTVDVLGNTTTYVYDASDQVIQTNLPNGTVVRSFYDQEERPIYVDDAHVDGQATNGTHTVYDGLGRVIETDRVSNLQITVTTQNGVSGSQLVSAGTVYATSTTQYNDLGQVTQTTDEAGQTTKYQYDSAGILTALTDPLSETTSFQYDADHRRTLTTDALGHMTGYVYNGESRLLKTIYADGTFIARAYDSLGRQTAVTDPLGQTTTYQYDTLGRLSAVVAPAVFDPVSNQAVRPTTQYGYDAYGDLTSITDARGRVTSFTFDQHHNQLTHSLPMGQTESATYDSFGRVSTQVDFVGQTTKYQYDSLGRIGTETLYPAGSTTAGETLTYQYDSLGRVSQVSDTAGSTQRVASYAYDLDSHVTSVTEPEGTVNYAYDPATGRHTETSTANSDIKYSYDQLGRLQTVKVVKQNGVTLGTPLVTTYFYTPVGNLDHISYANGTETDYAYDSLERLTSVINKSGTTVLSSYTYTLNADGVRTGDTETELESGGSTSTVTKTWTYDALLRLTQETYTTTISPATNNYTANYSYDLVGNRLGQATTQNGQTTIDTSSYDNNDRLTSDVGTVNGASSWQTTYGYDADGELTSKSRTGSGAETDSYTYNLRQELVTATINRTESGQSVSITASYTYDENATRAASSVTTTIGSGSPTTTTTQNITDRLNPSGYVQVLEEHLNGASAASTSYTVGLAVFSQATTSATTYLLPDGQGSTRLVTDGLGNIVARYGYDAYGNLLGVQAGVVNPPATRVLYTGQLFDLQLQQYYLRARYYDPSTGRFTQQDPFAGYVTMPLTLHRYIYTADNPVAFSDPSGRDLTGTLVTIGVYLNLASFFFHLVSGVYKAGHGDYKGASQDFTWAVVDLLFLGLPGLGAAAGGGGAVVQLVGVGGQIVNLEVEVQGLMQAGVAISSIYGWLATTIEVTMNARTGGGDGGGGGGGGGTGGSSSSGGGEWVHESWEGWSPESIDYHMKYTGEFERAYEVNGVRFDAPGPGRVLIDAKSEYAQFVDKNGNWKWWFYNSETGGTNGFLERAQRQLAAAGDRPVEWHVLQKNVADAIRTLFQRNGVRITVKWMPNGPE